MRSGAVSFGSRMILSTAMHRGGGPPALPSAVNARAASKPAQPIHRVIVRPPTKVLRAESVGDLSANPIRRRLHLDKRKWRGKHDRNSESSRLCYSIRLQCKGPKRGSSAPEA